MISTSELAAMRAEAEMTLPDTANIFRKTKTNTATGGQTATYPAQPTITGAKVRISPLIDIDAVEGRKVKGLEAVFVNGLDVRTGDRIVVGGKTYEVGEVKSGQTWEVLRRAEVVEV